MFNNDLLIKNVSLIKSSVNGKDTGKDPDDTFVPYFIQFDKQKVI